MHAYCEETRLLRHTLILMAFCFATPAAAADIVNFKTASLELAREKAEAVILSGVASSEFRRNRQDIRMEMNHVQGILVLEGGLPIRAGGALLGALGVSGAPGGDKDEACAPAALNKLQERLEFAD